MRRSWAVLRCSLLVLVCAAGNGCAEEEHIYGQTEIRVAESGRTLIGLARILSDGQHVGYLRVYRVQGAVGPHEISQVTDAHHNRLGYIDERGRAYRLSAHAGTEFVANSSDLRRNIAAIMGTGDARIEVIDEVPETRGS